MNAPPRLGKGCSSISTNARRVCSIYGIEEQFKALIATKCSGEKAPESLRERLRLEIRRTTIIRDAR